MHAFDAFLIYHRLFGLVLGVCIFLIIGLFHPLVIRGEYRFGVRCWWGFLLFGLGTGAACVWVDSLFLSACLGVIAFSSFWSIHEVFQQRDRVARGWFPANPKRQNSRQPKNQ
jgi:hypothetical protein